MWLWFAGAFAGLLGVSLGRTARALRSGQAARRTLAPADEEWRHRTLDIELDGQGDVALARVLGRSSGMTVAFRVIAADGQLIEVPAGLMLELAIEPRVVDGRFVAPARAPYSLYVSSLVPGDGPLRAASRIARDTKLILHPRGWNPVVQLERGLDRRWRKRRLAALVGVPAAITALIAVSPLWVWLGALAAAVLGFDAIFLRSAMVELHCTEPARHALPEG
ncbi:MAG TPA: hypothetical protein VLX92_32705 [Kofleriaceae bacterium]|nr:hypothetical protein [Kofleriaceae bacterium]